MKTNEDKLKKVIEDIESKKSIIEKCKQEIKNLNAKKKKLELEISKDKHKKLCKYLSELGISSEDDFQNFLDNYSGGEENNSNREE